MAEVFLINKKITVDKPLTGIISKYDKALLQFMTASLITNYNNLLLHLTIAWLLQFSKWDKPCEFFRSPFRAN